MDAMATLESPMKVFTAVLFFFPQSQASEVTENPSEAQ